MRLLQSALSHLVSRGGLCSAAGCSTRFGAPVGQHMPGSARTSRRWSALAGSARPREGSACASAERTSWVRCRCSLRVWLAVSPPSHPPLERRLPAVRLGRSTLGREAAHVAPSLRWELGAFTALAVDTVQCAARCRRSWINSQPALASSPIARMRHQLPHKTASLPHHSWPLLLRSRSHASPACRPRHPIEARFADATSAAATRRRSSPRGGRGALARSRNARRCCVASAGAARGRVRLATAALTPLEPAVAAAHLSRSALVISIHLPLR